MYTRYACLPPKTVSQVLSEDIRSGKMVALGCCNSSNSWLCPSVQKLRWFHIVHLNGPPPITCIHITIHLLCLFTICIVVAQRQKPTPVQTQDLQRSCGYLARYHKIKRNCYSIFQSIVLSLLIQTYPWCVFNYLWIIYTTGPFTSRVYSYARTCKCLSDLSVI